MYNIDRLVGIEIECCEEDKNDELPKGVFWDKTEDESVEYFGAEYKFDRPLSGNNVITAVNQLVEHMENMGARVSDVDAGFHLHINFGGKTQKHGIDFVDSVGPLYQYLLPKIKEERHKNTYCREYSIPVNGVWTYHKPSECMKHSWPNFPGDNATMWDRYYWIHPRNMAYGKKTVEVRLHHSTKNAEEILTWTELWVQLANLFDRGEFPVVDSVQSFNQLLSGLCVSDATKERFYVSDS